MNKIKVDKKTILTVASAVLGAGSFLVNNLYNKIRRMGMNQQKLSELTGISENTISNYCVGKGLPNVHNLKKICRALKCSVYELVDMEYGEEE